MKTEKCTFSILDSCRVSLKLGAGENPFAQTNIFFRRKEIDFFPIAFLVFSARTSLHLPIITLMVRSISSSLLLSGSMQIAFEILRLTSKLEGQLRNLSRGRSEFSSCLADFRFKSFVNSFCNWPNSSGVNSDKSGDEAEVGFCSCSCSWVAVWISELTALSLSSLLPNVPIVSSPWGQSLNSSLWEDCFGRSVKNDDQEIKKKS